MDKYNDEIYEKVYNYVYEQLLNTIVYDWPAKLEAALDARNIEGVVPEYNSDWCEVEWTPEEEYTYTEAVKYLASIFTDTYFAYCEDYD